MRISGLNSGMDIDQIVSDLVKAQRIPMDRVFQQKVKAEWKRDAYRDVNTKLSRFRNLAFDLTLQGAFQKKTASSSRTDLLTVSASGAAGEGRYDIVVEKLATAARVTAQVDSAKLAEDGSFEQDGSFRLGIDEENAQTIEYKAGETLEQLAARINEKKLGINAFAHEGRISLTTTATGKDAQFVVDQAFLDVFGGQFKEPVGESGLGQLQLDADQSGQDAQVTINGLEATFSSNTFEFNGITVNLLKAEDGTAVTIEVKQDVDAVVDKVKEFVDLYNELVGELNKLTREEVYRDFAPLTDEQKEAMSEKEIELWEEKAKSGLLRSDPLLNSILSEMRLALGSVVEGEGGNTSLRDIGITTGSWYEYGKLYLNEDKLRAAISEDPDRVRDLFTANGATDKEKGIARKLTSVLDRQMERITDTAGKASIPYDQSFLGNRIREYESRLADMEERLIRYEEQQWRKFSAMETALGKLYAQSDWLYQQLMAMQG
jgi:flagellar hook-associated protein 2